LLLSEAASFCLFRLPQLAFEEPCLHEKNLPMPSRSPLVVWS
jgi:hypothetical protein